MSLKVKGWMTYREAADRLGLDIDTVRRYTYRKIFDLDYIGEHPMVSESSVTKYEKNRRKPGNPNMGTPNAPRPRKGRRRAAH